MYIADILVNAVLCICSINTGSIPLIEIFIPLDSSGNVIGPSGSLRLSVTCIVPRSSSPGDTFADKYYHHIIMIPG